MKQVAEYDVNMQAKENKESLVFYSPKEAPFCVYGSGALHEHGFCRLTKEERDIIRPLNDGEAWFGEHSTGIQVHFQTDSPHISVRVKLREKFNMTNMTQIGQCGCDLYVYDARLQTYVMHEVARFPFDATEYEVPMGHFEGKERVLRQFILYLPLYMIVEELLIGLDEGAQIVPAPLKDGVKIAVYGTSIVQGGCATRPGLAYTNILTRRLNAEIFNFGFSGVAFMEEEMGHILGKRRHDILIVDTEPNAGVDDKMEKNTEAFLNAYLSENPKAGILLISRVLFALDFYDEERIALREFYKKFLKETAERYRQKGYTVTFADGSLAFSGNVPEYTVDGVHPNDIGMVLLADFYEKEIAKLRGEMNI